MRRIAEMNGVRDDLRVDAPLDTVPMFVRGGAIVPLGPEMNYVKEKRFDPITFAIYPDAGGSASTTLYEDDGLSPAYEQGAFRRTTLQTKRLASGYVVSINAPQGQYNPGPRRFGFVVKSAPNPKLVTIADDGRAQTVQIK